MNNISIQHYVPIRIFSSFSLLHSTINLSKILEKECKILSIIDNNLAWILDYGIELQNNGIHVIVGWTSKYLDYEVTFYVKNDIGYKNLCNIYCNSFDHKIQDTEGLICTIATCNRNLIEELKSKFQDDLYILVNRNSIDEINIADELGINILADHNVCHLDVNDYLAYKTLRAIDTGKYLVDVEEEDCNWKSNEEMYKKYFDIPDAVHNTFTLASKCKFIISERPLLLPTFQSDMSIDDIAYEGLRKRNLDNNEIYKNRLNYELDVIKSVGFSGYFLIVSDFVKFARTNNIPVGPGRGSGASSLVALCLDITDIDPIKMGLFFERFLNQNRVSMPDFDIDFCPEGRNKIIEYLQEKYNYHNVAHIAAFGRLQTKAALRDAGRALAIPYPAINKLCKMIPFIPVKPLTIDDALQLSEVQEEIENDKSLIELFNIAKQIEGLHRHESIHAAGVVVSRDKLCNIVPTKIIDNQLVVSCEVSNIEKSGLIKFDLLGLTNLTIIKKVCDLVHIDITKIPEDDAKTFQLLNEGRTHGVFQLEGRGMQNILMELKISSIEEIIAVVSLYRPGPMKNIQDFIRNKYNRNQIEYEYEEMKPILEETFGIIVFQEQVLQISQKIAGYSIGEADLLRRAIGKKKPKEMELQKIKFINGIVEKYGDRDKAEKLFDTISTFAGYAFCKAHAAPYGIISYQTAYLKSNYPYEFTLVMLNTYIDHAEEIEKIIRDSSCKIIKPDINISENQFSIREENGEKYILYGLSAIKNIGHHCLDALFAIKDRNFTMIEDLVFLNLNRKQWENLIFSGALDSFKESREDMMEYVKNMQKSSRTLFTLKNNIKMSFEEMIEKEKQALGFILTDISSKSLERIGVKIGEVYKCERYKNVYKILVEKKLLFSKKQYSGIVIYNEHNIFSLSEFLDNIKEIVVTILKEEDMHYFSTLKKGKCSIIFDIHNKKLNIGKYKLEFLSLKQNIKEFTFECSII